MSIRCRPGRRQKLLALLASGFAFALSGCALLVQDSGTATGGDAPSASAADGNSVQPATAGGAAASAAELAQSLPLVAPLALPWTHHVLPGKTPAVFQPALDQGRPAVAVRSSAAASMLRTQLRLPADQVGRIRFSWKVAALIANADLRVRDKADAPARVMLAFEGDRSRFSPRDAMLNELARSVAGEEMPYATLVYAWCNTKPAGTVIRSPRTDRIRKICVETGRARLGRWVDYERDVRADFERAFGEAPGALLGVALMSDTDNTRGKARAWYGPLSLLPPPAP